MNEAEEVRKFAVRQLQSMRMRGEKDAQFWMGSSGDVERVGVVRGWLEEFNCSRDSHFSTFHASLVQTLTKSGLSLLVLVLPSAFE